jgi:hypothetical protein
MSILDNCLVVLSVLLVKKLRYNIPMPILGNCLVVLSVLLVKKLRYIILMSILGNCLVVLSVLLVKKLRYIILCPSLATVWSSSLSSLLKVPSGQNWIYMKVVPLDRP